MKISCEYFETSPGEAYERVLRHGSFRALESANGIEQGTTIFLALAFPLYREPEYASFSRGGQQGLHWPGTE